MQASFPARVCTRSDANRKTARASPRFIFILAAFISLAFSVLPYCWQIVWLRVGHFLLLIGLIAEADWSWSQTRKVEP